uniref:c-type lectin-like protein 18, MHCY region n=1 Tax=Gallus gallus TaxID=9031 RepID=UPI000739F13F|nr:c-type lectin-like protein 18, MHCY region [Gallus gallus]WGA64248.1 c-type lectin [Gallus gallus]WGU24569.1 c-type lectin [Gallus gallus]WGU33941.1 c-type lectin [Gallus gallus]DBA07242.1 TPA_asm: c-type lectin [Gallus gallus]|eukprot:XP_015157574.1 C-type lectin domain family 2 member B isoform X1 [Gallus gallus]
MQSVQIPILKHKVSTPAEGERLNHFSEHKAAPEPPAHQRRRIPTSSDPQLPEEDVQILLLESNTSTPTIGEGDQQETFSEHKAVTEPLGQSTEGDQWGSWCHGTGRRRSRVQLIAVCAALGALILMLVVISTVCRQVPVPSFPDFAHVCPNAWVGFQGKCYYLSKEENDWNSSREHCNAHGASLATIGSAEEMDLMMRFQGPAYCWIGLHREEEDAQWTWSDGTAFTNWFELRGGGRCAYLNGDRISSSLCHLHKHWVCSRADHYVLWKQKVHPQ